MQSLTHILCLVKKPRQWLRQVYCVFVCIYYNKVVENFERAILIAINAYLSNSRPIS